MTQDRYTIRVSWGDREESLAEIAERFAMCLRCLARADVLFTRVFETPRHFKDAFKREIATDAAALERLLVRGGLSYYASSPNLTLITAAYPGGEFGTARAGLSTLELTFTEGGPAVKYLFGSENALVRVLECLVGIGEPKWAGINTLDYWRSKDRERWRPFPPTGLITHVSVPAEALPLLPMEARVTSEHVVPTAPRHSSIFLPEEQVSGRDQGYVAMLIGQIYEALEQAGIDYQNDIRREYVRSTTGRLTYVPVPPEALPSRNELGVARVEALASGSLVVLSEEPLSSQNPAHVAALDRASEKLRLAVASTQQASEPPDQATS